MNTIWKHELEIADVQDLMVPASAQLLSVAEQYGKIVLYSLVRPSEKARLDYYTVSIVGTGHPIGEDRPCGKSNFLGTVKLLDGAIMFHVFAEFKERKLVKS